MPSVLCGPRAFLFCSVPGKRKPECKITQEEKVMYKKVDSSMNFVDREKEVVEFWNENSIFTKSMDTRKQGET